MKVAISGANGFIGSALVKKNLLIGNDVNILTTNLKYKNSNANIFIIDKEFNNETVLNNFFKDVDIFYNCLGEISDKKQMHRINIELINIFVNFSHILTNNINIIN